MASSPEIREVPVISMSHLGLLSQIFNGFSHD